MPPTASIGDGCHLPYDMMCACRNADISTMELVFPVYSAHASSSLLAIYVPLFPFSPNPEKKINRCRSLAHAMVMIWKFDSSLVVIILMT